MATHSDITVYGPLRRYYERLLRRVRNVTVVLLGILMLCTFVGVPHIQYEYTYARHGFRHSPNASEKLTAWYLSITGWKLVHRGDYGPLKIIIFVPWKDCLLDSQSDQ